MDVCREGRVQDLGLDPKGRRGGRGQVCIFEISRRGCFAEVNGGKGKAGGQKPIRDRRSARRDHSGLNTAAAPPTLPPHSHHAAQGVVCAEEWVLP